MRIADEDIAEEHARNHTKTPMNGSDPNRFSSETAPLLRKDLESGGTSARTTKSLTYAAIGAFELVGRIILLVQTVRQHQSPAELAVSSVVWVRIWNLYYATRLSPDDPDKGVCDDLAATITACSTSLHSLCTLFFRTHPRIPRNMSRLSEWPHLYLYFQYPLPRAPRGMPSGDHSRPQHPS